jgi:hypothetical protein
MMGQPHRVPDRGSVLKVGHFSRALLDHFCLAAKIVFISRKSSSGKSIVVRIKNNLHIAGGPIACSPHFGAA